MTMLRVELHAEPVWIHGAPCIGYARRGRRVLGPAFLTEAAEIAFRDARGWHRLPPPIAAAVMRRLRRRAPGLRLIWPAI